MKDKKNIRKKRSLREDWGILKRGIGLVLEISPRYFICNIFFQIGLILSPYFSMYMSACFINELSGQCDPGRLAALAGITILGLFAIKAVNRLIQARRNIWMDQLFQQEEIFMADRQYGLQYEHLENTEVSLLREQIFADKCAGGKGLFAIYWNMGYLISNLADLFISVSLTVSIFRMTAEGQQNGFLAFVNSPYCALLLAAILLVHVALTIRLTKERTVKDMDAFSEMAEDNVLYAALSYVHGEDVSIFRMKKILVEEYQKRIRPSWCQKMESNNIRYGVIDGLRKGIPDMAVFLVTAAKAFVGVFGIGNFVLYKGTVNRFCNSIVNLASGITELRENNEYLLHLYRFLDLPDNMYHGTLAVEKRDDIDYEIEFRNVSFRYPNTENWVLRNVNMKFRVGDKLAIVGENGSGKTTFIKLLCRLYDPTEGVILLNGIDITRYRYEEYLSLFSVVFQDFKLFQFSLAANIAGSFAYDASRVEGCLARAGFADRLAGLENGIKTVIGRDYENDGIDLSGGEQQKVALARALYKDAPFVILDEPTAALDPMAEAAVYENFQQLVERKTAVFISHRLSSCRFCDDIIVFDKGRLVQRGRHDALAAEAGKYRELWNAQAQYYA